MKNCQQREESRLKVLSFVEILFLFSILVSFSRPSLCDQFTRSFNHNLKPLSENSTVVLPTFNETQKATNTSLLKSVEIYDQYPWFCQCSSDLDEESGESACYCEGRKLVRVPQNLPRITKLTIANAHIAVLRENALKVYAGTLKDL